MFKYIPRFLPSYVGGKSYWINRLSKYQNTDIVELFCGSGVISANIAKTTHLNDIDPYIYQIIKNFDKLIVPDEFSSEDYFNVRNFEDWWKYAYCLQKMSFSGIFRYGKNGYNVPIQNKFRNKIIKVKEEYNKTLERWKELNPLVTNKSFEDITIEEIKDKVVISDPPYENTQASYVKNFDFKKYWDYINDIKNEVKVLILFETYENLEIKNIPIWSTRKTRVNGKYSGGRESMAIYRNNKWLDNMMFFR